jgi:soluble lytic murein transglycosylase-like protein
MSGSRNSWLWVAGGIGAVALLYMSKQTSDVLQSGIEDVQAAVNGWMSVNQGFAWMGVLNNAELQYNIPTDLLARVAYQESRFRQDVIDGTTPSPAGALGIMQLMPQYFSSVNVPRPYQASDTTAQIAQAGALLSQLYAHFGDWGLALAGYNDGQTNIDNYLAGAHTLPQETIDYVSQILADVPLAGATIPA